MVTALTDRRSRGVSRSMSLVTTQSGVLRDLSRRRSPLPDRRHPRAAAAPDDGASGISCGRRCRPLVAIPQHDALAGDLVDHDDGVLIARVLDDRVGACRRCGARVAAERRPLSSPVAPMYLARQPNRRMHERSRHLSAAATAGDGSAACVWAVACGAAGSRWDEDRRSWRRGRRHPRRARAAGRTCSSHGKAYRRTGAARRGRARLSDSENNVEVPSAVPDGDRRHRRHRRRSIAAPAAAATAATTTEAAATAPNRRRPASAALR